MLMPLDPTAMSEKSKLKPPTRFRGRRLLRAMAICLVLGFVVTVGVAWLSAVTVDPTKKTAISATGQFAGSPWSASLYRGWGAAYVHTQWARGFNWSPAQATGAPDTPTAGDKVTAWASASADGTQEWLILDYEKAVIPARIDVHENHCPGAINRVMVFDENGREVQAWAGTDPTPRNAPSGAGVSKISLNVSIKTRRIKVYIDSQSVPGWNEIDAALLTGVDGTSQWASGAMASSWYGSGATNVPIGPIPANIAPRWSGLQNPPAAIYGPSSAAERGAEARGWPMLALWTPRDPAAIPPAASTAQVTSLGNGLGARSTQRNRTTAFIPAGGPNTPGGLPPTLPWRPIWDGLLFNTVFYAVVLGVLGWLATRPRLLLVEVHRMRRGCCLKCGYDLGFDFQHGCAWCGWRRSDDVAPAPREKSAEEVIL